MLILFAALLWACVGQKEPPEPDIDPDPDPVVDPDDQPEDGTRAFHRVLALEFTATWCQYCPNMSDALHQAKGQRPGRIVEIAVHQYDEVSPEEADAIVAYFKVSDFPSILFDWNGDTRFNEQSAERITGYVDATVVKPTCNMALECSYSEGKLDAKVTVMADEAASYSVAAALVQDNIIVDNQAGYGSNYSCSSVLRRFLGAGTAGEAVGSLEKDQEKEHSFTADIDLGDFPEADFRVVAFVRKNGNVVNAISAGLNEKVAYRYEKDN